MTKFNELLRGPALVAEAHLQEGASEVELRAAVCNALTRIDRLENWEHKRQVAERNAKTGINEPPAPDRGAQAEVRKLFEQLEEHHERMMRALEWLHAATGPKSIRKAIKTARLHRKGYEAAFDKLFDLRGKT